MPEYRRRLPHFHPEDAYLFLTWRLSGILFGAPPHKPGATPGQIFVAQDRALHRLSTGPRWLGDPRIADLMASAILYGESGRHFYELYAWVVMPNHVHMLILPLVAVPKIMRWLKGSTAREANRILDRTGQQFWQDESYDHYLRNESQFHRTVNHLEGNPVSAQLVRSPEDWLWSSANWQAEAPALPKARPLPSSLSSIPPSPCL